MTTVVTKIYPFEILVEVEGVKSKAMPDQIRTVDCQRLGLKLGKLSLDEIDKLDKTLKLVLSL